MGKNMSKILLIDDDIDILDSTKAQLEYLLPDCNVLTACAGEEGIQLAIKEKPDVILLDVIMPDLNGFEVSSRLKSSKKTLNIPIILLTSMQVDAEKRARALKLGADAFLSKPTDESELIAQINVMLRIKKAEDLLLKKNELLKDLLRERERTLEESDKKYRSLFDSISDMVLICDISGRILEINRMACSMLGYEREGLLGNSVEAIFVSQYIEKSGLYEQVLQKPEYYVYKTTCQTSKKNLIPVEITNIAIKYNDQDAVLAIARDITEHLKIEEVQLQLQSLIDSSDDAIIGTTVSGVIVSWNSSAEKIYGYKSSEICGCSLSVLIPPYYPDEFSQLIERVRAGERVEHYETVGLRSDDNQVNVIMTLSPVNDSSGEMIGVSVVARDYTEYSKTKYMLKKGKDFIKTLGDINPVYYVALDSDARVLTMNKTMLRALGYSSHEVINNNYAQKFINKSDREIFQRVFDSQIEQKTSTIHENSIVSRGGNNILVEWHGRPFIKDTGELDFIFYVGINITERKRLEKIVMNDIVNDKNRIGHDLHNLLGHQLSGIVFKSEILKLKLNEVAVDTVKDVEELIKLVNDSIDQTRELAKGLCPVDLTDGGLKTALNDLKLNIEMMGITCLLKFDDSIEINNDFEAATVYYIINETVVNTVNFCGAKNIFISLMSENGLVSFEIVDDGHNSKDPNEEMFINILRYRAWIVGAILDIQKKSGAGKIIRCGLRGTGHTAGTAVNASDGKELPGGSSRKKSGVLIVDEYPVFRQGLVRIISREEDLFVAGEAKNADEAIRLIERVKPAMVTVDNYLGGASGIDLVKALKSRYPDLPVLVISNYDESIYAERAVRAGAMGYVMKQESLKSLMSAIRTVLGGKQYLSDSAKEKILEKISFDNPGMSISPAECLTDREFEIFQLIGHGLGNRHIADKLRISVKTVENYREKIKNKLSIDNSPDLIQFAVQWVINLESNGTR